MRIVYTTQLTTPSFFPNTLMGTLCALRGPRGTELSSKAEITRWRRRLYHLEISIVNYGVSLKFDKVNAATSLIKPSIELVEHWNTLTGVSENMLTDDMLFAIYGQRGCCSLSGSRTVLQC